MIIVIVFYKEYSLCHDLGSGEKLKCYVEESLLFKFFVD